METRNDRSLSFGRKAKAELRKTGNGKTRTARKAFSESFLFTLGLAFIIVYIAGLLSTVKTTPIEYEETDAVAVFAESGAQADTDDGGTFWDMLDKAMERAFSGMREDAE